MLRVFWTLIVAALVAQNGPTPLLDLTNFHAHDRVRQPVTASGSGHIIGSEGGQRPSVPVALELLFLKKDSHSETTVIAELKIRNIGRQNIEIPVDPSSRDFEPASPSVSYRYLKAYVWLAAEPTAEQRMPGPGLYLYGSRQISNTLRILKPGESLRIRANIPLPPLVKNLTTPDAAAPQAAKVRAFLAIFDESIAPQTDGLHSSTEEIFPTITSTTTVEFP